MSAHSYDPSDIVSLTFQCILCDNLEDLYPFPEKNIFRNLWLYRLNLNSYKKYFRVCRKHFSEKMLTSSGELVELAVPDTNVPDPPILKNKFYDKLIDIVTQPQAIHKQKEVLKSKVPETQQNSDSTKVSPVVEAKSVGTLSQNTPNANFTATNASMTNNVSVTNSQSNQQVNNNWLNDTSTLLMDYQLRVQGKHVCDVVEVPEYVVVFTIVKPKDIPSTQNALVQNSRKENINPLLTIRSAAALLPTETIEIDDDDEEDQPIPERDQTPDIDYVYYSLTEESVPTREREVQVDIPNNTCETGIQCDVELENDMLQMAYTYVHRIASHSPILRVGMHECQICGEIMPNYSAKVRHESGHKKRTSLCPRCGEVFSNPIKLKAHESDAHLGSELDIRKALRCPKLKCNKAFHSRKQLNNHIDDHIRHVDHKCIKCRQLFTSALKLNCHLKAFRECSKYNRSITRRWSRRK